MLRSTYPAPPRMITEALQGLAYWMGYTQAQYRFHSIGESAIVAALRSLLQASRMPNSIVDCEVLYKTLLAERKIPDIVNGKTRCDLVIYEFDKGARHYFPTALLEVKRGAAGREAITSDLQRLQAALQVSRALRAFLIVTYEAEHDRAALENQRFINNNGVAARVGLPELEGVVYRVRRVLRATHSAVRANRRPSGHYCCLLEVKRDPSKDTR